MKGPSLSPQETQASRSSSSSPKDSAREAFILCITGGNEAFVDEVPFVTASKWYTDYLESKIRTSWTTHFAPVAFGIENFRAPCEGDIAAAYHIMTAVWEEFRRQGVALVQISDALYNNDNELLKDTDNERTHANHLVFAAVGWLS